MKVRSLDALVDRLSAGGQAEFHRLYDRGVDGIRSDAAFEQAFDEAERILEEEAEGGPYEEGG